MHGIVEERERIVKRKRRKVDKGCFEGERYTMSQSESKQVGAQVKESHHATVIDPTNLSKTLTPAFSVYLYKEFQWSIPCMFAK